MKNALFLPHVIIVLLVFCTNESEKSNVNTNETLNYVSEGRGVWIDNPGDLDWEPVMQDLERNGINMVFPEMCSSGAVFLPQQIPPDDKYRIMN